MKNQLQMIVLSCLLTACPLSVMADATTAQKEQIVRTREQVREVIKTDAGCKALCQEMMRSKKAKHMMWEMMKTDPEMKAMMK